MSYKEAMFQRAESVFKDSETTFKQFMNTEMDIIKGLHEAGEGGLKIAQYRACLIDEIIGRVYVNSLKEFSLTEEPPEIAVLAIGGYGRGHLNPASDIDLLFLLPVVSKKLPKELSEFIQSVLYKLWDLGLKLGYSTRNISECIEEAKNDQLSKTAMMDVRLIVGEDDNLAELLEKFEHDCIQHHQDLFFEERARGIKVRHGKYSQTVFLQEPNPKESCGGMRDYHNLHWLSRVKKGYRNLSELGKERILTKAAVKEIELAYDFLHRVRNDLHFHTGSGTDILTLRLQGVVATNFKYPEKSILRRCESFMRDYYRHTKALHQRTLSLLEIFEIEIEEKKETSWTSWLTRKQKKREKFDGFVSRDGRISAERSDLFESSPKSLMSVFLHCQKRGLDLSPQIRKQLKNSLHLVDKNFRSNKDIQETFRAILESKGNVAHSLRQMHRVSFLGAYLPEFGAMDCLVQHEFFHRYTADEHTLRCIDKLDELLTEESREKGIYSNLLRENEDPYALYLALVMHDSGRAENVREHTDGSAMLTARVCTRLKIRGNRRKRIMFLVDHHLTFWRYATSRNLEDPDVIEEFAGIMKEKSLLKALFLFTYADSNGTNDEAWSPWKESLLLQLYRNTLRFMAEGRDAFQENIQNQKEEMRLKVNKILKDKYNDEQDIHFKVMPDRYFQYRAPSNIAIHVRAARRFKLTDQSGKPNYIADMRWIQHSSRGYTELIITCWNHPLLLEKACCALAAEEINIISADVFTREDNIVCDVFRVCDLDFKPIEDVKKQKRVLKLFTELCQADDYDPSKYLKKKKNLLRKNKDKGGIPFPVRAYVRNDLSDTCSALEVQALDGIGLLHDLFLTIGKAGLATTNARICTEKGAALNTIYLTHPGGAKVEDPESIQKLEDQVAKLLE